MTSTLVLVALFREHWAAVSSKTPLETADLDRVEMNAQTMFKRLNEREQGVNRLPALELRARAMSKLIRTCAEVRRMITYVRCWEEDADTIAPSLWSGRRGKSRVEAPPSEPEVIEPTTPVAPVTPAPFNGEGPFTS